MDAREKPTNDSGKPAADDPSPDEITRRAKEIRRRWSARQRKRRRSAESEPWQPPIVPITDIQVNLPSEN